MTRGTRPAVPVAPQSVRRRRRPSSGTPTLADVARLVGVTTVTVSRALNTPEMVAPETLERVREAVGQIGYVPNLLAGALSRNRSGLVVALVPTVAGAVFIETMQALTEGLAQAGYQLLIGQGGYDESREQSLLDAVIGRRPDGIVLTGVAHSAQVRRRLRAASIPVVETWDLTPDPIDMLVGFSHTEIGKAAAEYLHRCGRRRPAVIAPDDRRALLRAQSFSETVARLNRGERPVASERLAWTVPLRQVAAPPIMGAGRVALSEMLAASPDIDAIFCGSDMLALGVLIEARARGIAVPDQLSVIGYGDLSFAHDADPPLTTVRIDGTAIGKRAAELLVDRAAGRSAFAAVTDVGLSIVVRGSA